MSQPLLRQPLSSPLHLNYSSKKSNGSYTDQRVEEIKKKYDTNSRFPSSSSKISQKHDFWDKENQVNIRKWQHDDRRAGKHCSSHRLKTDPVGHDNPKYSTIDADLYRPKDKHSSYQTLNNLPSRSAFKLEKFKEKPSLRMQTQYSSSLRFKDPLSKPPKKEFYDSRMQNIDRINSKIRKILDHIQLA